MSVKLSHFEKAIENISVYGDNDTLPFDIDTKFIKKYKADLATLALEFYNSNETKVESAVRHEQDIKAQQRNIARDINNKSVYFERLLVPAGLSGFRTSTKTHPFWNIYFNGLGIAISEKLETKRQKTAYSYRYQDDNTADIFQREFSWRYYKEQTLKDKALIEGAFVVQTDISNFYEHVYHHRVENFINDLFGYVRSEPITSIGTQVDRLLSKFSAGRSFGLPVGSQCSRVLAELFMDTVDLALSDKGIVWHRYVDDITLIAPDEHSAYKILSELANVLANLGLSLNKTKTIILSSKHYHNYVSAQLGLNEEGDRRELKEIDVFYDPYSDTPHEDYESLKEVVRDLDVEGLLKEELNKGQPDTYLVSKISQTLEFHDESDVLQLLKIFLGAENLHAFRGSWSTIMRTTSRIRRYECFKDIFGEIDNLLDAILNHSQHLLVADTNILFFIKAIRYKKTSPRARFLNDIYISTQSLSIKRACIECWGSWLDRSKFIELRNKWEQLHVEEQRMLWFIASSFNDDGYFSQNQISGTLKTKWSLGLNVKNEYDFFVNNYMEWAKGNE